MFIGHFCRAARLAYPPYDQVWENDRCPRTCVEINNSPIFDAFKQHLLLAAQEAGNCANLRNTKGLAAYLQWKRLISQ
jgi:hypothetical protein